MTLYVDHGKGRCITHFTTCNVFFEIVAAETSPEMNYNLSLVNPRTINPICFVIHTISKHIKLPTVVPRAI
jgi:hypothetical protein